MHLVLVVWIHTFKKNAACYQPEQIIVSQMEVSER